MPTATTTVADHGGPPTRDEFLEITAFYQQLGMRLFPLRCHEERPTTMHGYKDAEFASETVRAGWFNAEYNIGVAVGQEHYVIDCDSKEVGEECIDGEFELGAYLAGRNLELPPTLTVTTANNGLHLYYRVDHPVQNAVGLLPCVDSRGHDGYVVGAGSTLGPGKNYSFRDPNVPIATLPAEILEIQESLRGGNRNGLGAREGGGANPRLDRETAEQFIKRALREGFRQGERENGFYYLSVNLLWCRYSGQAACDVVAEVWKHTDQSPEDPFPLSDALDKITKTYADTRLTMGPEPATEEQMAWVNQLPQQSKEANAVAGAEGPTFGLPIITLDELRKRPRAPWLFKGKIRQQSSVLFLGVTDAYKTFVAVDLSARIVLGDAWFGDKASISGGVLYVAAESAETIAERVDAWEKQHDMIVPSDQFHVMTSPTRLKDGDHMDQIMRWVNCHKPIAVVIDTLSKSMGPGTDENSNSDLTVVLIAVDRIKASGAAVFLLHHPGHGNQERERGAYALRAGVDTRILVQKTAELYGKLTFLRQKRGKLAEPIRFKLAEHQVHIDEDGDIETSLAVACAVGLLEGAAAEFETRAAKREDKRDAVLAHLTDLGGEKLESVLATLP